jgi:hypothetical protein
MPDIREPALPASGAGARPGLRERMSDTLLRVGTTSSLDSRQLAANIAAHRGDIGYTRAAGALALAQWVDSAILWLSWRLRPKTITRAR